MTSTFPSYIFPFYFLLLHLLPPFLFFLSLYLLSILLYYFLFSLLLNYFLLLSTTSFSLFLLPTFYFFSLPPYSFYILNTYLLNFLSVPSSPFFPFTSILYGILYSFSTILLSLSTWLLYSFSTILLLLRLYSFSTSIPTVFYCFLLFAIPYTDNTLLSFLLLLSL